MKLGLVFLAVAGNSELQRQGTPMEADARRDTYMSDQDTSVVGTAIRDGHVRAAIIGAEADTPREQTQPVVPAPRQSVSVKGTWSEAEDAVLRHHVVDVKTTRWSLIATALPGRNGKQCRERWHNHLKPDINKDDWTAEEDEIVRAAHGEVGNKWTEIARRLKGRTDNQVCVHALVKRNAARSDAQDDAQNPQMCAYACGNVANACQHVRL